MKTDYLYLNNRDELFRIDVSKIVYMKGEGNYTHIVQKNKLNACVCINLLGMQKLISDSLRERATMFVRVGKGFIINITYIYHIHPLKQLLLLSDGENFAYKLECSKEALKALKDLMVDIAKCKSQTTE